MLKNEHYYLPLIFISLLLLLDVMHCRKPSDGFNLCVHLFICGMSSPKYGKNPPIRTYSFLCYPGLVLKGEFRVQYKLGSNERSLKVQKNEPSLTFMCQLVLEILQFKVIFPPHMGAAIFIILSLIPIIKKEVKYDVIAALPKPMGKKV